MAHGGIANNVHVALDWLDSEIFEQKDAVQRLEGVHGILVPGGFGERGAEGKMEAARFAREKSVPYFGICFGMQMAVIEAARHLAGLNGAGSTEFGPCADPVVGLMTEWMHGNSLERRNANGDMGGTMRLGAYEAVLEEGSRVAEIYGATRISERHRHRYEVNIAYKERLERTGLRFSGMSPDGAPARDRGNSRAPLVHRRAVSSRAEIAAVRAASAVHVVHKGGARTVAARLGRRMTDRTVTIGKLTLGNHLPLVLIAGPCALESRSHALEMSHALVELAAKAGVGLIYKTSFDKANRTALEGARGIGLDAGLPILAEVRERYGCPVLTDVHLPEQCAPVAEAVDVLQIPAFLCRQTDLLVAAAVTGRAINIKKGQFLAPWDMKNVAAKVAASGNERILLCERGASFGYNTLVSDMRSLPVLRATGYPVVFDATHSVQQPGGQGDKSGGERAHVPVLARAAVAVGVAAVFMETHQDPDHAPSDGPNMVKLKDMPALLETLVAFDRIAKARPIAE